MSIAIWALLCVSVVVSASPLSNVAVSGTRRLQKRAWVLECPLQHVPVEAHFFATFGDLCAGYPNGFGLYCDEFGQKSQRTPLSLVTRTYGAGLVGVCMASCVCQNIVPDVPSRDDAEHAQFMECAMSDEESDDESAGSWGGATVQTHGSTSCPVTISSTSSSIQPTASPSSQSALDDRPGASGFMREQTVNGCYCSETMYGKPLNEDCHLALTQLPDHGTTRGILRDFLKPGAQSHAIGVQLPPVRLPKYYMHGTCVVALLLPEGPDARNNIVVDTLEMNGAAEDLRDECVEGRGIGGNFHQDVETRLDDAHELPEIVMFEVDSQYHRFLQLKYRCTTDSGGKLNCSPHQRSKPRTKSGAYGSWRYTGKLGSQGWSQGPNSKGDKQACSGSCYDQKACDINSDCLCAAPDLGIPMDISWGQHKCMWVQGAAHAAAALAAATLSPKQCRGRCLIQADGTLDIGASANASNASVISIDDTKLFANLTDPSSGSPTEMILGNTSDPTSGNVDGTVPDNSGDPFLGSLTGTIPSNASDLTSADITTSTPTYNSSGALPDDPSFPSGPSDNGPSVVSSNDTDVSSINGTSSPETNGSPTVESSNDTLPDGDAPDLPPEYAIFNNNTDPGFTSPSPILNCPCNCTYVSAACCLSSIVYEDPSMQVHMDPPPANASICCDTESGQWLPKSSGECSSSVQNGSATGFIGLGNVKWHNNSTAPIGFPGPEDNNT